MWPACFSPARRWPGKSARLKTKRPTWLPPSTTRWPQLVFVRRGGRLFWDMKTVDSAATVKQREYSLCRLLYGLLCARTRHPPALGHDDRRAPGAHHPRYARGRRGRSRHRGALFRNLRLHPRALCHRPRHRRPPASGPGSQPPAGLQRLCGHPVLPHALQLLQLCLAHGGGTKPPARSSSLMSVVSAANSPPPARPPKSAACACARCTSAAARRQAFPPPSCAA